MSDTRSTKEYIAAADVLRVAAIALVAWYHFWQQSWLSADIRVGSVTIGLQKLVSTGYMMVDATLVLSGFLLALPRVRARREHRPVPDARHFYRARALRILPGYLTAVLGVFAFYALPKGLYSSAADALFDLAAHLTFTHNLSARTYFASPIPGVLWTVAVEAQFYLLFPLLDRAFARRPAATLLGMTAAALAARLWTAQQPDTTLLVNQLPCMLDLFACGMGAALLYVRLDRRRGVGVPALVGMLVCFAVMLQLLYIQPAGDYESIRHGQLAWRLPFGIAAGGFALCGALIPPGAQRVLGNRVTRALSRLSYGFYIWHQFLACRLKDGHIPSYTSELPNQTGEQPWQTLYMLLCPLAALAVSAGVTYAIEQPIIRRYKHTSRGDL